MQRKRMDKKQFFFAFLFAICLVSCAPSADFREDIETPNGWEIERPISFEVNDSLQSPSQLYIHLRNDASYPFSNIFLIASIKVKDSLILRDTLEYAMANPDGSWKGTGFTQVKESKLWWKTAWQSQLSPPYTFEIAQANRKNGREKAAPSLPGIVSVGLSIQTE